MYETLLSPNAFLMQADPERRLAHRQEIKRALAEITVKKTRLAELRDIIAKLNADSDRAAGQHSEAAGRLQTELDELDAQQIEHVLAGKSSPPKAIERRRQILDELTSLNQILETTCEANRRSSRPLGSQISALVMQTTAESALQNALLSLCSVELRQKIAFISLRGRAANFMLQELQRLAGIQRHNLDLSVSQKNSRDILIHKAKLADTLAQIALCNGELLVINQEIAKLQAEALAE